MNQKPRAVSREPRSVSREPRSVSREPRAGYEGWDEYAPFYDWENAQTQGRRDVAFWRRLAKAASGHVLELGCGTGRIAMPLARAGVSVVGVDRSSQMLAHARRRVQRSRYGHHVRLLRGDIRDLPFPDASFGLVMAPYGILQSLLRERDLGLTLKEVARVLVSGGTCGLELVADLPSWCEYRRHTSLQGPRGADAHVTLIESVRQDRARGLTLFDQEFVEERGPTTRRKTFTLAFRTLSVPQMTRRLSKAGLDVTAILGDYDGGPWDSRAEAWIVLARKGGSGGSGG
jgi:ubiquinone/menaquinone biosynthesis C-methylase UbiE